MPHAQKLKVSLADALLAQDREVTDEDSLYSRDQHQSPAHRLIQASRTNDKRVHAFASYKAAA